MKEILFHGKRIDNGEWVEGFYFVAKDIMDDNTHHYIIEIEAELYPHGEVSGIYEVDPSTVGQYTGLPDKNGKKIFEGAIVIYDGWSKRIIQSGKVLYMEKEVEGLKQLFSMIDDSSLYEVIGNIHDNPELLEAIQ